MGIIIEINPIIETLTWKEDLANTEHHNVVKHIVGNDVCVGCGVCVVGCPTNHLSIKFDKFGKYSIHENQNRCIDSCNICMNICAFNESAPVAQENSLPEKEIKFHPITGYYKDLFVGHVCSDSTRLNSSSGGLTRFLLVKLLKRRLVDYVIHVVPNFSDPEKLFKYSVSSRIEDVVNTSRSAYYPVEISESLAFIKHNEGNYAIVGLPCLVKSIRNLQKIDNDFRKRIRFLFSLTCAQNKTKYFTDYIFLMTGASQQEKIDRINFREKYSTKSALDYTFSYRSNETKREISYLSGINKIWGNRLFTINACNFCNDIFGIKADLTIMDAWLPHYINDWKGNNISISRNNKISTLLNEYRNNKELNIKSINLVDVLKSQKYAINQKEKYLEWKLSKSTHHYKNCSYKNISTKNKFTINRQYIIINIQELLRNISLKYNRKKHWSLSIKITFYTYIIDLLTKHHTIDNILFIPMNNIKNVLFKNKKNIDK